MLCCTTASAAPFPSTDQNPLLGGRSLTAPARLLADGQSSARLALNWSSTATIQQAGNETLIVDAESREWRFSFERALNDRFELRMELPYRITFAGSLDSVIENWHSFFGLPNGDRVALPRDRLAIDYRRDTAPLLSYTDTSLSGVGDLAVDLGYQLHRSEKSATSLWTSLVLPTGDAEKLTGNEAFGGSVALSHTRTIGKRFEIFGHAGLRVRGSGEVPGAQQKSVVWEGMAGADYRATQHLTFTLQLDSHSATFEGTALDLFGTAHILTLGGDYAWPSGWRLQIGVAEDVKVEASPDVTFLMNLRKSW